MDKAEEARIGAYVQEAVFALVEIAHKAGIKFSFRVNNDPNDYGHILGENEPSHALRALSYESLTSVFCSGAQPDPHAFATFRIRAFQMALKNAILQGKISPQEVSGAELLQKLEQ